MKNAIKNNMLGVLIENFKVIDREWITIKFRCDIYGDEKYTYYGEFIQLETYDLFKKFRFINDVHIFQYGFFDPQSESLFTENNNASMKIEINSISPYKGEIEFKLIIKGEPKDISMIADSFDLQIELQVVGSSLHQYKQFWQESLYSMYHLYQIGNFTGAFMNAFIAFEGYLRSITKDYDTKIALLYRSLMGKKLTDELKEYRDLRNDLMHGNEVNASMIYKDDIINILSYFLEAYYEISKRTKASSTNG